MVVHLYGRMHGKWGKSGSTRIIQTCRNMSCVLCIICNTADWFSSEFPIRCCTCGSEKPRLLCSTTTKRSSRSAGTRSHQGCGATAATWALQLYSLWLSGDNLCELRRQQSLPSCHSVEQPSVYLPVKIIKKKNKKGSSPWLLQDQAITSYFQGLGCVSESILTPIWKDPYRNTTGNKQVSGRLRAAL